MLNELAIFQKTYELVQYLYPLVNKFPKAQRFVLGQRIENSAVDVLEGIITANSLKDKGAALERTSVELEKLRVFMRLGKDLRFMSFEQFNVKLFRKKLKKLEAMHKKGHQTKEAYMSLNSWIAHAKQADTHGLRKKIIRENPFILDVYDEVKYAKAA